MPKNISIVIEITGLAINKRVQIAIKIVVSRIKFIILRTKILVLPTSIFNVLIIIAEFLLIKSK